MRLSEFGVNRSKTVGIAGGDRVFSKHRLTPMMRNNFMECALTMRIRSAMLRDIETTVMHGYLT